MASRHLSRQRVAAVPAVVTGWVEEEEEEEATLWHCWMRRVN
jgi:hypothetical protein